MTSQPSYNLGNNKNVCGVALFGTYVVTVTVSLLLCLSFSMSHNPQILSRLIVCCIALIYVIITHRLLYLNYHHVAAYLITLFYMLLATGILWTWGIDTPIGTLVLALAIILAGVLLTARHALLMTILAGAILAGVQMAVTLNWHTPETHWMNSASNFGDALGYMTVFSMLALISWLYNREVQRSLRRAQQAESDLLHQKAILKLQVKARTAELRRTQLEEMQHMYRFAELGQLGTTLLHDLANYLTALTLEIEGMQSKQHAKTIARARQIIRYLGAIVDSTRERLHGSTKKQTFNLIRKTGEVVDFLQYKASQAHVIIDWEPPAESWNYRGDPTCLCQVVATITNNAIDAYQDSPTRAHTASEPRVVLAMQQDEANIMIRISNWGKIITKSERKRIFKPFYSTKKTGLGLGLFIAKQTMEMQFSGTVALDPHTDRTEFIIKLPRQYDK